MAKPIRRPLQPEIVGLPGLFEMPIDISSPLGGQQERPKAFWFNINAELVIYGGTEPDAIVSIDGLPIQLRPDGTFSCRFALPDGQYQLSATALSIEGDSREAELRFNRRTQYRGEVGAHPRNLCHE